MGMYVLGLGLEFQFEINYFEINYTEYKQKQANKLILKIFNINYMEYKL